MKNWLFQTFLILSLFSLFGVILGKMRHVEIQQVYVELPPVYRHSILEMVRNQSNTLLSTENNQPLDSDSFPQKNLISPTLLVQQRSMEQFIDPQVNKEPNSTLKSDEQSSTSQRVAKSHTDIHSESWVHKIKSFFSNLFYSDKAKQRDEIEQEVKRLEKSSQTQDGDLPKPNSFSNRSTSELLVPEELTVGDDSVAPLLKNRQRKDNIQTPKNIGQKKFPPSQDKNSKNDLVSSKYLLDNIFK